MPPAPLGCGARLVDEVVTQLARIDRLRAATERPHPPVASRSRWFLERLGRGFSERTFSRCADSSWRGRASRFRRRGLRNLPSRLASPTTSWQPSQWHAGPAETCEILRRCRSAQNVAPKLFRSSTACLGRTCSRRKSKVRSCSAAASSSRTTRTGRARGLYSIVGLESGQRRTPLRNSPGSPDLATTSGQSGSDRTSSWR